MWLRLSNQWLIVQKIQYITSLLIYFALYLVLLLVISCFVWYCALYPYFTWYLTLVTSYLNCMTEFCACLFQPRVWCRSTRCLFPPGWERNVPTNGTPCPGSWTELNLTLPKIYLQPPLSLPEVDLWRHFSCDWKTLQGLWPTEKCTCFCHLGFGNLFCDW